MAAPIAPAKKLANGRDTWWLIPTVETMTDPKASEVNATTGLNLAGLLLSDYEGVTSSTDKVTLPRVLMETTETEINGTTKLSASDMQITFDPQASAGEDGKKAWELLNGGTFSGYAVRRQDSPAGNGDVAAGEFVDVIEVEVSQPIPGKTSTGADGIYIFTAPVSPLRAKWNVAVV